MKTRVLLIEDNEQNRYLLRYLLEKKGFEVVCESNGLAAAEVALEAKPDLILLDIQLPGADGYEVAGSLRANEALAHVPIIAVTSFAMIGDREKAIAAGCNGYIEKPINPESFVSEIESYLKSG